MANYASYHKSLAKHLGWEDMFSRIAINAIDTIVFNHMSIAQERHGEEMTPEMSTAWLLGLTPKQVFGFLGDTGDPNYLGSPAEERFIELKPFFEYTSKSAKTCGEAIKQAEGLRTALEYYALESMDMSDVLYFWKCDELPHWAEVYVEDYIAKYDAYLEEQKMKELYAPSDDEPWWNR